MEMTFAQRDQLEAERRAKKRECVERLAKVLVKEFTFEEIRFVQYGFGDAILVESFEIARNTYQGEEVNRG